MRPTKQERSSLHKHFGNNFGVRSNFRLTVRVRTPASEDFRIGKSAILSRRSFGIVSRAVVAMGCVVDAARIILARCEGGLRDRMVCGVVGAKLEVTAVICL